jgi:hypothetical protein
MDFVDSLEAVVREVEEHVANGGWDQPVRLFALVRTATLLEGNPDLELDSELVLTSVEQELGEVEVFEEFLGTLAWPEDVEGAVVVLERVVLPPEAEADLPQGEDEEIVQAAIDHPQAVDVRIVSAVLRSGQNLNALRQRSHDTADAVAVASNLVASLNEQLLATFAE